MEYNLNGVVVKDLGLSLKFKYPPYGNYHCHTGGREKHEKDMVEQFINCLMRTGRYTGKKQSAWKLLMEVFKKMEENNLNPLAVLTTAVENCAPIESSVHLQIGGTSVWKAVDVSSERRFSVAIKNICSSVTNRKRKNKSTIDALFNELMYAYKNDANNSSAIRRRLETERIAQSAR